MRVTRVGCAGETVARASRTMTAVRYR
jgi:hypothetical protein